ncbi:MAG TPA: SRPBCC domain-containing protein [Dehalococcoidia bacterium]|nr:SRPBCC domain-containing protein [Dehalococcoidia bacterium]
MNETALRITRVLEAPIERVFAAWTDPAQMARWFFVQETWSADVENDLRVGGAFSIKMRAEDGLQFDCGGVYQEIEPPTRLVFSWTSYAVADTRVTIELRDAGGATELTLIHEDLVDIDVRKSHAEGWGGCLVSLDRYLRTTR